MFKINGKVFYGTLAYLDKVIEEDCVLPVLSSYLIIPGEGQIRMVASDTETTISVRMQAVTGGTDIPFLIDAKRFTRTMKEMPEEDIEFRTSENTLAYKWSTGSGALGIVSDTEAFPVPDDGDRGVRGLTLPASCLSGGIGHVLYAVPRDDTRPALCGVHFDVKPGSVSIAASNAYVVAVDDATGIETRYDASFTIGLKPASIIRKIASKTSLPTDIFCGEKEAVFVIGNFEVGVRLICDKYPDYGAVIRNADSSPGSEVCLEKGELLAMVRRVAASSDTLTNLVTLSLSAGRLSASGFDFGCAASADDAMECEYYGENVTVNLTAKRLIPALENFPEGKVRLRFAGEDRPVMLRQGERDTEGEGTMSVAGVMPVRQ